MNPCAKNEYLPLPARLAEVRRETHDVSTFVVKPEAPFVFRLGQFAELSVPGEGEVPVSIASEPGAPALDFTIRAAGRVTRAIHALKPGDPLHLRGPYGSSFPLERLKGRRLFFIAGGIGLAPLRGMIRTALASAADYDGINLLYGARSPADLCYRDELKAWAAVPGAKVFVTVDKPAAGWTGRTGLVTGLWEEAGVSGAGAAAAVCGPPVMIKFAAAELAKAGFSDEDILVTLERHMKCGVGKCGHCNIGGVFVCTDGPVFDFSQVRRMPASEGVL